ncbi:hypothetical protein [Neorhizobium sp. T7_12]|nr:hypothetical protein [Neorhizobium sp. T7_12]
MAPLQRKVPEIHEQANDAECLLMMLRGHIDASTLMQKDALDASALTQ